MINTGRRSTFKRTIDCNYQQVVSGLVKVPATQMASKKVTIMVGTFLNEESFKVSATETEAQKGSQYGGYLFLNEDSIKVSTTKIEAERLPIW